MTLRKSVNPFYILLVLTGIAFFITASAYGVMTVRGLYPHDANGSATHNTIVSEDAAGDVVSNRSAASQPAENRSGSGSELAPSGLMDWLDKNGFRLLMAEIVVLAVFTFAAIGTDTYWSNRDKQ